MRITPWLGAAAALAIVSTASAQEDPKALFQSRYDAFRSAVIAQDQVALGAILAPGYTMVDIQGETRDATAITGMMQRMGAGGSQAGGGRNMATTVLDATINGSTATVKQQLAAAGKRTGPDGAEMSLEILILSDDTWVKSGDAWLLKSSVQKDLTVKRDGEVFFKQSN